MSNSSLVNYTKISPNKDVMNHKEIKKITIHHMAGNLTVEQCGNAFQGKRKASANYGVGTDGRVGLYVDEKDRSYASANYDNDAHAVTIEVANDVIGGNWHVSDVALNKTIDLCTDICRRNGIKKLTWTGDKNGTLTVHRFFIQTACPGDYLMSKMPYIAETVTRRLNIDNKIHVGEKPTNPNEDFIIQLQSCVPGMKIDGKYSRALAITLPIISRFRNTKHRAVMILQNRLIALGYSCGNYGADCKFGTDTKNAVVKYQADHGLKQDGIVGELTWTSLMND